MLLIIFVFILPVIVHEEECNPSSISINGIELNSIKGKAKDHATLGHFDQVNPQQYKPQSTNIKNSMLKVSKEKKTRISSLSCLYQLILVIIIVI